MEKYNNVDNTAKYVPIAELELLGNNPRTITRENFEKLKNSVSEFKDFFEGRPCLANQVGDGKPVVFAGNQRLRAARELGWTEVPCVIYHNLPRETQERLTIKDNVELGDWNFEILANEFDPAMLAEEGVEGVLFDQSTDELIDAAGDSYVHEMSDDTSYDESKFTRADINARYRHEVDEAVKAGLVRPALAEIMRRRIEQCVIFNFDELAKYYRSGDSTEVERKLMRELFLVVVRPKKLIEEEIIELDRASHEIYNFLMEGAHDGED